MEDCEIIELFFDRSEAALREVSRKYGLYCKTIARNILNNSEEADECVNETYIRAWESIPPKRPPVLRAFLGRITKNLALNRVRSLKAENRGGGETDLSFDELDDFVSGEYSVEIEAERKEIVAALNRFLDKLPSRQRQLFVGIYWGCFNIAQLAEQHGMSPSGVSENIAKTRKQLKKYLSKRGFDI